jgi:predicted  nucleic acid-binding Zn-ribbon protein
METWTIKDELNDFLQKKKCDLEAIRKAAQRNERDKNYISEKYGNIERTLQRFQKRLNIYDKALLLV